MRLAGRCYYRVFCGNRAGRGGFAGAESKRSDRRYADAANRWTAGSYDVWLLKGNCRIQQGAATRDAARHCCGSSVPTAKSGRIAR